MREETRSHLLERHGGFFGLLGLRRGPAVSSHGGLSARKNIREARSELVGLIGDFLIENNLEITASNLSIAHGVASGLNPGLRRRVEKRREDGLPITQEWIERAVGSLEADGDRAIEFLAEKLERGISDFSRTTRNARHATSSYGAALEAHVGELESQPDSKSGTGQIISELASFARAMLERSRDAEAELRQSEQEAATLRKNLELAQRDAEIDPLTGLPNRRAFETTLQEEIGLARADNEPLCIAFCDIDRFKAVNDKHGHEAGDRILCVVAQALNTISGSRCHIARHGGEEFVLLFRGLTTSEAFQRLDGIRHDLAQRRLVNRRTEQPFGTISFSAGISEILDYANAREALAAADEALYQAKQAGRNCIKIAADPE